MVHDLSMATKRGVVAVAAMASVPALVVVILAGLRGPSPFDDLDVLWTDAEPGGPLASGSYGGTLVDGAYEEDRFTFHLERGQLVWLRLDGHGSDRIAATLWGPDVMGMPDGPVRDLETGAFAHAMTLAGQSRPFLAYASGQWQLRTHLVPTLEEPDGAGDLGIHTFEILYTVEQPEHTMVFSCSSHATAVEAHWDEPTDLYLHVQMEVRGQEWRPDHAGILLEFGGDLAQRAEAPSLIVVQQDLDGRLTLGGDGVEMTDMDPDGWLEGHGGVMWYNWRLQVQDVKGSVRVSAFQDAGLASFRFLAAGDEEGEWKVWTSDATVRWEAGGDQDLVTPLASNVAASQFRLDVPERFLGVARVHEDQSGRYQSPGSDDPVTLPPMLGLRNPAPGSWDFEFDAFVEADQYQYRSFYGIVGAHLPELGLFDGETVREPAFT